MLKPNIIKIPSQSDWLLTFTVLDPETGLPATPENSFAKFCLYDNPRAKTPLWSCEWNTGIQEDPIRPGVLHILVPRKISDYLPPGIYTYELNVVSKLNPQAVRRDAGTIESVRMDPNGGIQFGVSDNVARQMVGRETLRALQAEEDLREDIAEGGGELGPGSVKTENIADQAVTEPKIADGAVTRAKIASGAIPTVLDNSVGEASLQTGAVTTEKIHDGAVTPEKLAGGSITSAMLADNSITGDKLADESIDATKLDPVLIQDVDEIAKVVASLFRIGSKEAVDPDEADVTITPVGNLYYFNFALPSGYTPQIVEGKWFIGGVDQGVKAAGIDGVGITNIEKIGDTSPVTHKDTYRITVGEQGSPGYFTYDYQIFNLSTVNNVTPESVEAVSSGAVYKELHVNHPALVTTQKLPISVFYGACGNTPSIEISDCYILAAYYSKDGLGTGKAIPMTDITDGEAEPTVIEPGIGTLIENWQLDNVTVEMVIPGIFSTGIPGVTTSSLTVSVTYSSDGSTISIVDAHGFLNFLVDDEERCIPAVFDTDISYETTTLGSLPLKLQIPEEGDCFFFNITPGSQSAVETYLTPNEDRYVTYSEFKKLLEYISFVRGLIQQA